ncbi:MAG: phosphatidylserine/phosphatidylglycerophosphate/cardiolipin synthase family protein [Woeseiaceae bacterium]|nr:phosphatidylserine/phosphatidylglycerophosphate/cardiolipin synthase family protein [Woeseiaceae bacterium]
MSRTVVAMALLFVLAAGGCSTPKGSDAPNDIRMLPGRFAEEPVTQPLRALDAFIGPEQFYLKYEGEDGIVYAGGHWSERVDLSLFQQETAGEYSGPFILPLEYHQDTAWAETPEERIEPVILTSKQWNRFIDKLFATIIPKTEMTGVVMHFDDDDYFLYYNDINNFEARLIIDKPEHYTIAERIDFEEFMRRSIPVMEDFLEEEGVADRRLLFSTGDAGRYSLPFVYVNMDLPMAAFVRYAPAPRAGPVATEGVKIAQSLGHVAHSNATGLINRPLTSVYRLFFVAKDVAAEAVRPTWLVTLESEPVPEVSNGQGMDLDEWETRLDTIVGRPSSSGSMTYLIDGEEFFTRFIDAVSTAQESVAIRTYIFDNDDFAEKVGNLLRRRAAEGIDIRILLDGLGTIVATRADDVTMPAEYEAPESVRLFLESDSDIRVRQSRNPWLVAGDHVKTTIIDNELAFAGGMNIGREYRYIWHDLMMELRGPIVGELVAEFEDAWAHAGLMGDVGFLFSKLKPDDRESTPGAVPLRVLHTRPGDAEIFNAQRAAIRAAKRYIYIENAYFTDDAMLYELAKARRRGVDVRIILPMVGNHGPINKSNVLAANAMLEHGIRVFVYPGMSHVKAAVFDGWACLGSANWDKLSFRTNRELNIATSDEATVKELLDRLFRPDFEAAVELTEPFPERWSDHLAELLADYLL